MRTTLIKNSFSGIILLILTTILVFVSVSVFNKKLGNEIYGIYATLMLIGNVNIFSGLGINSALLIFLSEKGKCRESDHNIIVAFSIVFVVITVVTVFAILYNYLIITTILNISGAYYTSIKTLYILLVLSNEFVFIGLIASAILDSMQKMYLTNMYQLMYNIIYNFSITVSILLSNELLYIGIVALFSSIIWVIMLYYSALKKWGIINFKGIQSTYFHLLKKQISLGSKVYISGMVFFFYEPLTKILISHFMGVKEVGFFDIALKVRNQIAGLISKAGQPLLPYISQLQDKEKLRLIIHDLEQKIFYFTVPAVLVALFCTEPFIRIWIGGEYVNIISTTAFWITTSFLVFSSPMNPQYMYLMSKGHASKTISIQLTNAISNFTIILLTYKTLGYYSFVLSYSCAIIISFILMLYYQKTLFNSLIFDSIAQILKIIITFIITLIFTYFANTIFQFSDIVKMLIDPFIITLFTVLLYKFLKVVNPDDLVRYLGKDSRIFNLAKKVLI